MPIPHNPRRMNYSHHDADFDEDDIPTMIGIWISPPATTVASE